MSRTSDRNWSCGVPYGSLAYHAILMNGLGRASRLIDLGLVAKTSAMTE